MINYEDKYIGTYPMLCIVWTRARLATSVIRNLSRNLVKKSLCFLSTKPSIRVGARIALPREQHDCVVPPRQKITTLPVGPRAAFQTGTRGRDDKKVVIPSHVDHFMGWKILPFNLFGADKLS